MATYNLISNITNGAGLQKDTELLRAMLVAAGHSATCSMFNDPNPTFRQHDINIFLEVVRPEHMRFARESWILPNSEWWYDCWDPILRNVSRVLCKTLDCYRLWCAKVGPAKCVYLGFEANDFYRPEIERQPTFLHLAGKSETKNTAAVMAAWREFHLPYPLIVSAFKPNIVALTRGVRNVTQVDRFSDEQAVEMLNRCRFHIMPSKNEGFGHAIHEALSCKGVVITTDAPPMNEFSGIPKQLLIPVSNKEPRLMTHFYNVTPANVAAAVHNAAQLYDDQLADIGENARNGFLGDRAGFREAFAKLIGAPLAQPVVAPAARLNWRCAACAVDNHQPACTRCGATQ